MCIRDRAALQRAGDKAAGVVVRSIGDSETLGVFNKRVAWKVVSDVYKRQGSGPMNMEPVRFGVIGCGLMGREFASV